MRPARRTFLLGAGLWMASPDRVALAQPDPNAALVPLLRAGGVVIAFRHALAPGTFDPPGFVLEDCRTQRNLDDVGRAQSARIGQWFARQGLKPSAVRSSPWCRCLDTARIAFGAPAVQPWAALGSPRGTAEQAYPAHQATLRESLGRLRGQAGFEVWVTHMFVLQDLVGVAVGSGDALVLRAGAGAGGGAGVRAGSGSGSAPQNLRPEVLGPWRLPA